MDAGIVLAVLAALSWATMDVLRKRLAARVPTAALLWGLTAAQVPLFAAWLALAPTEADLAAYAAPGLATLLINLAANLAFLRALEIGDLSRTIPLLSLTPAITIGTGAVLLGEWPAPAQLAGIALVVAGTVALTVRRAPGRLRLEPSALLMMAVAAAWSLSAAVDKIALQAISVPGHGLAQSVGLVVALTVWLGARSSARRALEPLRAAAPSLALAALVMAAAASLQYLAIGRTLISLVETIKRGVGASAALAVGAIMFEERVGPRRLAAAATVVVGTALVLIP